MGIISRTLNKNKLFFIFELWHPFFPFSQFNYISNKSILVIDIFNLPPLPFLIHYYNFGFNQFKPKIWTNLLFSHFSLLQYSLKEMSSLLKMKQLKTQLQVKQLPTKSRMVLPFWLLIISKTQLLNSISYWSSSSPPGVVTASIWFQSGSKSHKLLQLETPKVLFV